MHSNFDLAAVLRQLPLSIRPLVVLLVVGLLGLPFPPALMATVWVLAWVAAILITIWLAIKPPPPRPPP